MYSDMIPSEYVLDINFVKSKIKSILNKAHNIEAKKVIKYYPNEQNPYRINFACPVCGDSEKSIYKKRGNLYTDTMMYKCFNCDVSMSFTKLCDTFNETIDIENRIRIYKYLDDNIRYKKNNEFIVRGLDKLIPLDDFINHFNSRKDSWLNIRPVQENSLIYKYLKNQRMISDFSQIYEGVYKVIRDNKLVYWTPVIVFMNMLLGDEKRIIGIQLRNLENNKDKRFYKIVEFEDLYRYIYPNKEIDEIEMLSYNKLSHFFNILNVDFGSTVTVFEGFLDSLFFPNSIGMIGAGNDKDLLKFLTDCDEKLNLRFFYDNDATGISKSIKMLKMGYPVFLWKKLFEKLMSKEKDRYKAQEKLKNIVDLNDLVIRSKNPNVYKTLHLEQFFSTNEFDLVYLSKNIF